ncbi:putative RNA methyltransferase TrmH, group 3 [Roseibium sp. TrichSKD4]|uniref:TfoX/Sxy family protein n=1 Tax=Roseibium sp. TrichSKD4 TaxID=744980 RepID=UPI0001E561ED|nr:TfoX/Sxy family protein [Roseibium sp. TrichSKD4]EFO34442.1 putative RNA methyltransferase TrmH, group 3 [Roseibium sp. TrichSKD4]
MAYDEELTNRFRDYVDGLPGLSEKRMMGGVCFLLHGNMVGGADRSKDGEPRFMFRVGKENEDRALSMPGGEPMVQGGRRMTGLFFVNAEDHDTLVIEEWVRLAVAHAMTLPAK